MPINHWRIQSSPHGLRTPHVRVEPYELARLNYRAVVCTGAVGGGTGLLLYWPCCRVLGFTIRGMRREGN
eukprot:1190874-Prorocentrum_minimum.AAC.2